MQHSIKSVLGLLALLLVMAFIAPQQIRADDADKNDVLPEVGIIAIRSIDAFQSFVKQTGVDLPPGLDAAGLEAQFVFIGKGGLDTTRPIGIIACGAPGLELAQMGGFAFPVKPTGGLLESIKAMGAVPMPGHPDTVVLNGTGLRRTADYLIFSPTPQIAVSVDTNSLLNAVKGPNVLFRYEWNFKGIRASMPEQYKKISEYLAASAQEGATTEVDKKNRMVLVTPIMKWLDTIDRADVSLESSPTGVKQVFSATPITTLDAEPADLPGMPADIFARLDIDAVPLESSAELRREMKSAFVDGAGKGETLTGLQKIQVTTLADEFVSLILDPAATSIAGGTDGTEPVLYIVQHWTKPTDIPAKWDTLIQIGNALPSKDPSQVTVEHYTDGDLKVSRFGFKPDKSALMYVDVAQKNNDVYMTASTSKNHLVASLAGAAPLGPMKHIVSGSVDLGKTLDLVAKLPDSPLASMPQETRTKLADLLKDQTVTMNTGATGQTGIFEVAISKELLRKTPKLIEIFSGMAAAAGEPK